jgi:hypothetical protein
MEKDVINALLDIVVGFMTCAILFVVVIFLSLLGKLVLPIIVGSVLAIGFFWIIGGLVRNLILKKEDK